MKKTLGLVMTLVMILTAVSAFAAVPSKTTADLAAVTTENQNVTVVATENETEAVTTLLANLAENNTIPAEVKSVMPAGSSYTQVQEVVTLKVDGGTAEEDLKINLKFPTNFAKKKVALMVGIMENGKIVGWKCIEAVGNDDGSVDLLLDGETQDWLNNREFVLMVAE